MDRVLAVNIRGIIMNKKLLSLVMTGVLAVGVFFRSHTV